MTKLFCFLMLAGSLAYANWSQAPKDFAQGGKDFTFIDIHTADYELEYDVDHQTVTARSKLTFEVRHPGYPLFDLVPAATKIQSDGKALQLLDVKMPDGGPLRALNAPFAPGVHTVTFQHRIETNVDFYTMSTADVRSAFWMSDLDDRQYLEQYLPTNLEFDQIKMHIDLKIVGTQTEHVLKTNGVIESRGFNEFSVDYPDFYTCSSMFFHLYPKGAFAEKAMSYTSSDGHEIKVQLYARSSGTVDTLARQAPVLLKELERDYGPWPHPHLIVYGAGMGGMEHVGATQTDTGSMGHEMHHSYFARGMIPARGNDGWIDEALASWRDESYRQSSLGDLSVTKMAGHSPYQRFTDTDAYSEGERIIGHLDQRFKSQGGMKAFLKDFAEKNMYQMNSTTIFRESMEAFFKTDLKSFFDKYVYGKGSVLKHFSSRAVPSAHHKRLSKQEQLDLL